MNNIINNEYFDWLCDLISDACRFKRNSYRRLLSHLHCYRFEYTIEMDSNREGDGKGLRYRFYTENTEGYTLEMVEGALDGDCSILEMMVGLATRCEQTIMDNPAIGDRTAQWFWGMIANLGLGGMTDRKYDRVYVTEVLERFLKREYEPDGKGGLFTIKNIDEDLRNVEIWHQLCWYLDTID